METPADTTTPSPVPPTQPIPPQPARNTRPIKLGIGIVLLLLIITIIIVFANKFQSGSRSNQIARTTNTSPTISPHPSLTPEPSSTPTPTFYPPEVDTKTGWYKYSNNTFGYSFVYPTSLHQVSASCTGPDRSACITEQTFSEGGSVADSEEVTILVTTPPHDVTLEQMKVGSEYGSDERYFQTIKIQTYNGIPTLIEASKVPNFRGNNSVGPFYGISATSLGKDRMYSLYYTWPAKSETAPPSQTEINTHLATLEKMLQSFTLQK